MLLFPHIKGNLPYEGSLLRCKTYFFFDMDRIFHWPFSRVS